jgi:hypothetical protein
MYVHTTSYQPVAHIAQDNPAQMHDVATHASFTARKV